MTTGLGPNPSAHRVGRRLRLVSRGVVVELVLFGMVLERRKIVLRDPEVLGEVLCRAEALPTLALAYPCDRSLNPIGMPLVRPRWLE